MYKRRVKDNIPYSHSIEQCIPHSPPSEKFPHTGVRKWYIDLSVDGIYVGLVYLQRCMHSAWRVADTGTNHSFLSFIRRQASRQDIPSHGSSYPLPPPRLSGQSFAIEHRMHEKKSNKFRPFLEAAGVEDAKRFMAFVLEASGRLGPDAVAFLEYLRTLCRLAILRFRALRSVISTSIMRKWILRWLRYLRPPI